METNFINLIGIDKRTWEKWKIERPNIHLFLAAEFKNEKELKSFEFIFNGVELGKIKYSKDYLHAIAKFLNVKEITVYRWRKKEKYRTLFLLLEKKFKSAEEIMIFDDKKVLEESEELNFFRDTSYFFSKIKFYGLNNILKDSNMINKYFIIYQAFKEGKSKKNILEILLREENRVSYQDIIFEYEDLLLSVNFVFEKKDLFKTLCKIPLSDLTFAIEKNSMSITKDELNSIVFYYIFITYYSYLTKKKKNYSEKIKSFADYSEKIIKKFCNFENEDTTSNSYTKNMIGCLKYLEIANIYFIDNYDQEAYKIR